jgi:H+-transporting ATPase
LQNSFCIDQHKFSGPYARQPSVADIAIVSTLALSGILMEPLPWRVVATIFAAAIGFGLILDQIKQPLTAVFKVQ